MAAVTGDQLAQSLKGVVPMMMAQLNMPELQNQVAAAVNTYLDGPKCLTISAAGKAGSRPDDHRRGHGRTEHHFFAAWRQGHGERLAVRRGVSQTPLPEAGFANLPLHPFSGKSE
jgi:hypothetical protein